MRFSVLLEEGEGLRPGAPVVLNGQQVGEVLSLEPGDGFATVKIEISGERGKDVFKESRFVVSESPEGVVLEIVDPPANVRTPVEAESVLDKRPTVMERLWATLYQWEGKTREAIEEARSEIEKALEAMQDSEEAAALRDSLAEFARDAGTVAGLEYKLFLEEHLPDLEKRAEAYRDELKREGRTQQAEIFWKWFTRWRDAISAQDSSKDEKTP